MTNKQLIKKLENACVVCRDCGLKYGVYSVGCSSVWEGKCGVCDQTKPVTETRDYAYLMTGIRKLLKEDAEQSKPKTRPFSELTKDFSPERKAKIKEQSKGVAEYMLTQEPTVTNHPITPPPEMVEEWVSMLEYHSDSEVFSTAAQWGADAELEACLEWISKQDWTWTKTQLREARRPKPPTLKEQALKALDHICVNHSKATDHECTIRRALEALPND